MDPALSRESRLDSHPAARGHRRAPGSYRYPRYMDVVRSARSAVTLGAGRGRRTMAPTVTAAKTQPTPRTMGGAIDASATALAPLMWTSMSCPMSPEFAPQIVTDRRGASLGRHTPEQSVRSSLSLSVSRVSNAGRGKLCGYDTTRP